MFYLYGNVKRHLGRPKLNGIPRGGLAIIN
jgi:hypothetical protein